MKKLDGKTVLITGGSNGIGLASVKLLASEGARIILIGRDPQAVEAAAKEAGDNSVGLVGDVGKLPELDRLFERINAVTDRLDVVFANAGIAELAPLGAITEEQFDRQFDVNVKGVLFTVQKALPLIPDGGSIILTSSGGHAKGWPASSAYSATKAAVRSFARTWTMDLKERGIRVNSMSPGPTASKLAKRMGLPKEYAARAAAAVPLGRVAEASEAASVVLFLASSDSSFITGADIGVDGGLGQV